jgi:hypothetical protein
MEYKLFPLMGFPGEHNKPDGGVIYQCFFPTARIALWKVTPPTRTSRYEVNLYKLLHTDAHSDDTLTDHRDRFARHQAPISVACALEAQLAINYLIQTHLPTGDTNVSSPATVTD